MYIPKVARKIIERWEEEAFEEVSSQVERSEDSVKLTKELFIEELEKPGIVIRCKISPNWKRLYQITLDGAYFNRITRPGDCCLPDPRKWLYPQSTDPELVKIYDIPTAKVIEIKWKDVWIIGNNAGCLNCLCGDITNMDEHRFREGLFTDE